MADERDPTGAPGRVRALAPVDRPAPGPTRWAGAKRALRRVLRLVTAPQAAFNHAAADAFDELAAELAACRRELAAAHRRLDELEGEARRLDHAVRRVHGPLLVDVIDRAGGLLAPGD